MPVAATLGAGSRMSLSRRRSRVSTLDCSGLDFQLCAWVPGSTAWSHAPASLRPALRPMLLNQESQGELRPAHYALVFAPAQPVFHCSGSLPSFAQITRTRHFPSLVVPGEPYRSPATLLYRFVHPFACVVQRHALAANSTTRGLDSTLRWMRQVLGAGSAGCLDG